MFRRYGDKGVVGCRLEPNHSLTWTQAKWIWTGLATITLLIAVFWAVQGAWLIVPFAGFELALVWWLMRHVCARTYRQEVLEIDEEHIRLEWGHHRPEGHWQGSRQHTTLDYWHPEHSWSPPLLYLREHNERLPLACDCPKADREKLLGLWKELALPVSYHGETRVTAHQGFDKVD